MKMNYLPLIVIFVIVSSCKKEPENTFVHSKWDLIPGNYKVYDTSGTFLYDTKITYSTKPDSQGGYYRFFNFSPFGEYGHTAINQNPYETDPNAFTIGSINGIDDEHYNHWVLADVGSRAYDVFTNDTLEFLFEKDNGPYWESDDTTYHHELVKQIAVKQH